MVYSQSFYSAPVLPDPIAYPTQIPGSSPNVVFQRPSLSLPPADDPLCSYPARTQLFFVLQFLQCLIFSVFGFVLFLVFSLATSPCIHTHTHTHSHSHSYVVNFLSIGIALYLTLHPLCLEQLCYIDEILPGSGKDRWRNTNPSSPNTSPFTYISFPQSLIGRQHILLVNYIGSIIILLELES